MHNILNEAQNIIDTAFEIIEKYEKSINDNKKLLSVSANEKILNRSLSREILKLREENDKKDKMILDIANDLKICNSRLKNKSVSIAVCDGVYPS